MPLDSSKLRATIPTATTRLRNLISDRLAKRRLKLGARGREKILVDGQLDPGSRTAEILLGGQVISVSAT